ncbi:MAG: acetyltransferase [Methanobacteriaceae archaeon]|jgi:acetyltransferase-like isoleucine patch superfamily enzyme|nr:acetyltransferase [Methanobacteriaceae archaeon]
MESVRNKDQINDLKYNKISGSPEFIDSSIIFKGKNNIFACESNVKLLNCSIRFEGNNSVVYLSNSSNSNYPLNLQIYNDSLVFFGRDTSITPMLNVNVQEHQNLIIGDDCLIGSNSNIRTSDAHPIYSAKSKKRINLSKSVFIGDHVWLGHLSYISRGVKIGSGAIIDNNCYMAPNFIGKSNSFSSGNPASLIKEDVFFVKEYLGNFKEEETIGIDEYLSRIYLFEFNKTESISLDAIDKILKELDPEGKVDFIKKLFIEKKKKNRFSIN